MIRVHVSPAPIDLAAEMAGVEHADGAGAVATFTGLVRRDDGVGTLELEHYPGATEAALTRLAEEATARWALGAATIVHRVGPMAPGIAGDLLAPQNRPTLVALLRYHIVPGTMTTEQLEARIAAGGGRATLTTLGGQPLTATMTGDVITLTSASGNRSYVEAADVAQANGVIHVVNGVLVPRLP